MHISTTTFDVRYAETDQMGIVHHSNYVIWFEVGRTQFMQELGLDYSHMERDGVLSPVTDIQVSYKYPAKYGEKVTVKTWLEHYNGIRIIYGYEILNEQGQQCVTGESSHACVKKDTFRPISVKKRYPEWHHAYDSAKKQPS